MLGSKPEALERARPVLRDLGVTTTFDKKLAKELADD